jgi:hypothetical protein
MRTLANIYEKQWSIRRASVKTRENFVNVLLIGKNAFFLGNIKILILRFPHCRRDSRPLNSPLKPLIQ